MVTGHRGLLVGALVLGLVFAGVGRADEDKKPRDKGAKPGAKPGKGYQEKGKGPGTAKGMQKGSLPPGLRNKPADHPGRKAYQQALKQKGKQPTPKGKPTAAKESSLPPGLRNKSANHPGRKGYLEGQKKPQQAKPAKKKYNKD